MQEINLYDLIKFYARKWRFIVILTVAGLAGGFVYNTFIQVPLYRSEATLFFINSSQQSSTLDVTLLNNYVQLFRSRRVLQPVIDDQKLGVNYDQFVGSVGAVNNKGTGIISLSISTENPDKSRNFLKEAVISFKKESKDLYGSDNLTIVDDASDTRSPYNVQKVNQLAVAGAIGLIISLVTLFFIFDIKGNTVPVKTTAKKSITTDKKVSAKPVRNNVPLSVRMKKLVLKPLSKAAVKPIAKKAAPTKKTAKKSITTNKKLTAKSARKNVPLSVRIKKPVSKPLSKVAVKPIVKKAVLAKKNNKIKKTTK